MAVPSAIAISTRTEHRLISAVNTLLLGATNCTCGGSYRIVDSRFSARATRFRLTRSLGYRISIAIRHPCRRARSAPSVGLSSSDRIGRIISNATRALAHNLLFP